MEPATNIKRFISNIAEKSYKNASDSLQQIVQDKLKERIKNSLEKKNK